MKIFTFCYILRKYVVLYWQILIGINVNSLTNPILKFELIFQKWRVISNNEIPYLYKGIQKEFLRYY